MRSNKKLKNNFLINFFLEYKITYFFLSLNIGRTSEYLHSNLYMPIDGFHVLRSIFGCNVFECIPFLINFFWILFQVKRVIYNLSLVFPETFVI